MAICMAEPTLQGVVAALYGRFRQTLFQGTGTVNIAGVPLTVGYDVQAAPAVRLAPPTPAQWEHAVQADGSPARPTANAAVLHFPRVAVTRSPGTPQEATATVSFDAIAVAALDAGRLKIRPVGVSIDLSAASPNDRILYRGLIIPRVLGLLGDMLSAEAVPAISFQGVRFGDAVLVLGAGRLAALANLAGEPPPAPPPPESLPTEGFCILLSPPAMQAVATAATSGLRGRSLSQSGEAAYGIGTAQYSATLRVDGLALHLQDPTTILARAGLAASASAAVDVLGPIWDQITGGVETAANAIKDAFSSY